MRFEEEGLTVLLLLEEEGGTFTETPGQLLHELSRRCCIDYKRASLVVLWLEEEGLVEVERYDRPGKKARANRLSRISIREDA